MHHLAYRPLFLVALVALLAACSPTTPAPASVAPTIPVAAAPASTPTPTNAPAQAAPTAAAKPATALPPGATPSPIAARATTTPLATAAPPPTATSEPPYPEALRPAFAGDAAPSAGMPRYSLRLRVDPAEGRMAGVERIALPNPAGAPLADVALRLYPNFPRDVLGKGGDVHMDMTGAAVDERQVAIQLAAQGTAALLPLDPPLRPNAWATLTVSFTASIRPWGDGTWPLPSYYPMLAVREAGGWRLDVTRFPDRVFAASALYDAEIDIPANLALAASGSAIAREVHGDRAIYRVVTGPVREFALTVGDLVARHASAGDVAVSVYTARGSRLEADSIAQVAARALADFDRRFGPYPYRELDIHLLVGDYDGGDEYPGLILLYSKGPIDAATRYVAAHEVAHQWWYGVVGDDIYRQPWLDEALAQYSGILYDEDMAGPAVAAADWEREIARRYQGALRDGDWPIGLAIDQYADFNVYYRTVYGKGALFLRALRRQLGDDAFFAGLRDYYRQHRYGIATTDDLRQAFERASGQDLSDLFRVWVTGGSS